MSQKPNVIFVMTDDQGYGDLGCTGNPWLRTPRIDGFSREAFRLENFHVSPLCTPTRGAIMSGRFPLRNGAWATTWGRSLLGRGEITLADHFRRGGYRTGIFGKWHLGDNYPYRPQDRGFDRTVIHRGGGVGQVPDFWGNSYFDDTYFHNGEPVPHKGYCTDIWFDEARRYMEECREKDEPYFCYIATNAPHSPYLVDDKYADHYRDNQDIPEPEFYGMIENIDENFGKLQDYLSRTGQEENTILIFMTDNGSSGGCELDGDEYLTRGYNGGFRGKKASYYEGGHRVPFFIRWPGGGITKNSSAELAAHVDLISTLTDLCGIERPESFRTDGISLAPLLLGSSDKLKERTLFFQYRQNFAPPEKWSASLARGPWRLVGGRELYRIDEDREQRKNLSREFPEQVELLRGEYEDYWANVEPGLRAFHPIVIGSDRENPTRLDSFDLMGDVAWNQNHILEALKASGSWNLEIENDGTYEFRLRRWPKELDLAITNAPEEFSESAIAVKEAKIAIQGQVLRKQVPPGAEEISFELSLKRGKTTLEADFIDDLGENWASYYVYAERL